MRKIRLTVVTIVVLALAWIAKAEAPAVDYLVFLQNDGHDLKTLYLAQPGATSQKIATGKGMEVFVQQKKILYFFDHQLYRYDLATNQSFLVTKMKEEEIWLNVLSDTVNQAILAAKVSDNETNWYILDLNDGSTRRISQPAGKSYGSSNEAISPDQQGGIQLKPSMLSGRIEMSIQIKENGTFKTIWTLPHDMTTLPDFPAWAPNSKLVAFYAKKNSDDLEFYNLYLFDLASRKMTLLQEQVFAKTWIEDMSMGGFRPGWAPDSKFLTFEYQPYGSPTSSEIIKYEIAGGVRTTLVNSPGINQYPEWSPSGHHMLFLSDRGGTAMQLYITNENGQKTQHLSNEGKVEAAQWVY